MSDRTKITCQEFVDHIAPDAGAKLYAFGTGSGTPYERYVEWELPDGRLVTDQRWTNSDGTPDNTRKCEHYTYTPEPDDD